jgi:hypothetical protein
VVHGRGERPHRRPLMRADRARGDGRAPRD